MPEICPSVFHIVPDKETNPYNRNDIFSTDRFKILQAETLTHVKEIVAHTGTNQPLHIRLLCCYKTKDALENYCTHRRLSNPDKQVCNEESGIRNNYIHFHIKMNKPHNTEYLLAFIEGSELVNNLGIIIEEIISSVKWLEIIITNIYVHIFTFGEPAFRTFNNSRKDELVKERLSQIKNIDIDYTILHISKKDQNHLSASLSNNILSFSPS